MSRASSPLFCPSTPPDSIRFGQHMSLTDMDMTTRLTNKTTEQNTTTTTTSTIQPKQTRPSPHIQQTTVIFSDARTTRLLWSCGGRSLPLLSSHHPQLCISRDSRSANNHISQPRSAAKTHPRVLFGAGYQAGSCGFTSLEGF